jgi:hypothetical protein
VGEDQAKDNNRSFRNADEVSSRQINRRGGRERDLREAGGVLGPLAGRQQSEQRKKRAAPGWNGTRRSSVERRIRIEEESEEERKRGVERAIVDGWRGSDRWE